MPFLKCLFKKELRVNIFTKSSWIANFFKGPVWLYLISLHKTYIVCCYHQKYRQFADAKKMRRWVCNRDSGTCAYHALWCNQAWLFLSPSLCFPAGFSWIINHLPCWKRVTPLCGLLQKCRQILFVMDRVSDDFPRWPSWTLRGNQTRKE